MPSAFRTPRYPACARTLKQIARRQVRNPTLRSQSCLPKNVSTTVAIKWSRGEKTAEALESNLTSLEKKIDDLLASFEESERAKVEEVNAKLGNETGGSGGKEEKA
ncbi:hypothetical protein WAI453_013423 [Rhynchosporium graminicola]